MVVSPSQGEEETSGGSPEFTLGFLLADPGHRFGLIFSESVLHLDITLCMYISLFCLSVDEEI